MAAGLRALREIASLIDVVIEVRDARVPRSTSVAELHKGLKSKPRLILLNRRDLAEPGLTRTWLDALATGGEKAFAGMGTSATSLHPLRAALLDFRRPHTRVAIVGAPNTGKSSVINALVRRKRTIVQNRAGITRHVRWIALSDHVDLLDTPGVLEPKVADPTSAWQLALCGILPDAAFEPEEVVEDFRMWLARRRPKRETEADLESFAHKRGMLRHGGELDRRNASRALIKDFRSGKFGRMTFEQPQDPK